MARAKGLHILQIVKVLRQNRERVRALLPPPLHKYLDDRILPSTWYPNEDHIALLRALAALLPATPDPWTTIGRGSAFADLSGLYRNYLRKGDPLQTMRVLEAAWRSAHDTGTLSITPDGPTAAIIVLRDFELRLREYCRLLGGYQMEAATLSGASDVRNVHLSCCANGDAECRWRVEWR